jgi:hypothetical protein
MKLDQGTLRLRTMLSCMVGSFLRSIDNAARKALTSTLLEIKRSCIFSLFLLTNALYSGVFNADALFAASTLLEVDAEASYYISVRFVNARTQNGTNGSHN